MSKESRRKRRQKKDFVGPVFNATMMWAAVVVAAVGAAMALYLTDLTFTIAAEGITEASACSINEFVNCDLVQASSYARLLGVPVAWWGFLFYVFAGLSALYGAIGNSPASAARFVAASFILSIFAVLFSVYKAFNLYEMGLLCPVCIGMYVANVGLLITLPLALGIGVTKWGGFVSSYIKAITGKETDLTFSPNVVQVGGLFLALFLIGGAGARNYQKGSPGAETIDTSRSVRDHFRQTPRQIEVNEDAPVWGNPDASVTIVEFADFQCPACRQAAAFFKPALVEFEDKVKFVFMNFPLTQHALARGAASAAICAQEFGDFWGFHDGIFQNQALLGNALYDRLAAERGWNIDDFRECRGREDVNARIEKELQLGIDAGLSSTPYVLVNGRRLAGWHIADNVRAILNEELSRQE